jgi:DNA polymerase
MLAYLAGEEDKLEAFRKYDRGEGPDIYCVVAEGIYGYPVTKKMPERQPGKVGDLAYGYEGGIGAYGVMSKAYDVDLMAIAPNIIAGATGKELERADYTYTNYYLNRVENPMPRPAGLAVDVIKQRWRARHPKTVAFWADLKYAAIAAVETRELQIVGGDRLKHPIMFFIHGKFLVCVLPSGRTMKYLYPTVKTDKNGGKSFSYCSARGWRTMYGGKWAENIVQAAQRDLLAIAIYRLKKSGFRVPLHTHDEVVCMSHENFSSLDEVKSIMVAPVDWAPGLPISVTGWEGYRYGKD